MPDETNEELELTVEPSEEPEAEDEESPAEASPEDSPPTASPGERETLLPKSGWRAPDNCRLRFVRLRKEIESMHDFLRKNLRGFTLTIKEANFLIEGIQGMRDTVEDNTGPEEG